MNVNSDSIVPDHDRQPPCIRKASTIMHLMVVVSTSLMLMGPAAAQRTDPLPLPSPIGTADDLANVCPAPMAQKIEARSSDRVETADMPPEWQAGNGLNGTRTNTWYGHTIRWNTRGRCCQVTRAVLTVHFKALQQGTATGSDAFNDSVHIAKNGVLSPNIPGGGVSGDGRIWQPQFPGNFNVGATTSKTITITNPAILSSGHLSFIAQDDTAITGATLTITGCCLNAGNPIGNQFPANEPRQNQ